MQSCPRNLKHHGAFKKNVRHDEESGELVMSEQEFINAVAPEGEDSVSQLLPLFCLRGISGSN